MKNIQIVLEQIQNFYEFEYAQLQNLRIIKYILGVVFVLLTTFFFITEKKDLAIISGIIIFFTIVVNEEFFKRRIRHRKKKILHLLKEYEKGYIIKVLERWRKIFQSKLESLDLKDYKKKLSFYYNSLSLLKDI